MERKRRHGAELQAAFDETKRAFEAVPPHLCMKCQQPKELVVIETILGDLQKQKETGELELQGAITLRICRDCYAALLALHELHGTPYRLVF
jgi:hypothetical protein